MHATKTFFLAVCLADNLTWFSIARRDPGWQEKRTGKLMPDIEVCRKNAEAFYNRSEGSEFDVLLSTHRTRAFILTYTADRWNREERYLSLLLNRTQTGWRTHQKLFEKIKQARDVRARGGDVPAPPQRIHMG